MKIKVIDFTSRFGEAKDTVKEVPNDEFIHLINFVGDESFSVAGWSRFSEVHDRHKVDQYLAVPIKIFTSNVSFMVMHTVCTGIGKIVTFREKPRYVLDPGSRWRSYLAAVFGTSRKQYTESVRFSRIVECLLEKELANAKSKTRSAEAEVAAAEKALQENSFDRAMIEQEVSHLREVVRRLPAE